MREGFSITKVALLIPCYNEEEGIGIVLDNIPRQRLANLGIDLDILVIDNNSHDKTAEVARSKGVRVITEKRQGKGCALVTGFKHVKDDVDIVAMIDGDASYNVLELTRLIEPIEQNFCDVVVGSRLQGKIMTGSMKRFNRMGNWLFTFLARTGYKTNVTDVCSGFFAWKKKVVDDLIPHLESTHFSIEMEMIAKMAKMDYDCYSMPISYHERNGRSNLRPIVDGAIILREWLRNITWSPTEVTAKSYAEVAKDTLASKTGQ